MRKLYEIYYQEFDGQNLRERIFPFESNKESSWENPRELMEHLSGEANYPHGGITDTDETGNWVIFEDGYEVKVTL